MHIKPKKSLGQNFLVDKNIQRKIIAACELKRNDKVLEIGAGRGELTRLILGKRAYVYALEIDPNLCKILKTNLKSYPNLKIINKDILKCNLKRLLGKSKSKLKVLGNIPYYITTPIIQHLIGSGVHLESIFITVQKEFARRMSATPGSKEYGSFSCFVQYYTKPEIQFFIRKTCFWPIPKVDSCLLQLKIKEKLPLKGEKEKLLFEVIRKAFNKRRKTLRNSLKDTIIHKKLKHFFTRYNIDPDSRPETLALEDFINLITLK